MADDDNILTEKIQLPAEVQYKRRTDRSPEKNFEQNSESNKILFSEVRRATENARLKLTKLEDEVSDRDKKIEKERELRKIAEDKLQAHLRDPYNNPEVNKELRQRLPRSSKSDPLLRTAEDEDSEEAVRQGGMEDIQGKEEGLHSGDAGLHSPDTHNGVDCPDSDSQIVQEHFEAKQASKQKLGPGAIPKRRTELETSSIGGVRPQPLPSGMYRPLLSSTLNGPYLGGPLNYYYGRFATPYLPPSMYLGPQLPSSLSGSHVQTPSSYSYNLGVPLTQPVNSEDKVPSEDVLQRTSTTQGVPQMSSTASVESSPCVVSGGTGILTDRPHKDTDCGNKALHHTETSTRNLNWTMPALNTTSYLRPPYYPQPPLSQQQTLQPHGHGLTSGQLTASANPTDQSKQMALLLSELDAAKEQSKKFAGKLAETERELESTKMQLKVKEVEKRSRDDLEAAAGLVQEVHAAQRKREECMMGRLKLASQERDEALFRLHDLEHRLDEGYSEAGRSDIEDFEEEDVNERVESMLSLIDHSDSVPGCDQECSSLIRRLERVRERQREITSEEMQALIDERDRALARASRLEDELLREQQHNSGLVKNDEQHVKAKIACLEQERDMALAQVRQLKDEVQTIRIYYSLHKSLSQECLLRDQVNNTLYSFQSKVADPGGSQKDNNILLADLRGVTEERDQLMRDLEKMELAAEESRQEKEKLKKLVGVLRRKLTSFVEKSDRRRDRSHSS